MALENPTGGATNSGGFTPLRMVSPVQKVASTTAQTLADANSRRRGLTVRNAGEGTLWLDYTRTVSEESHMVALVPGAYWEAPYGCIDDLWGVWSATGGEAHVREFVTR